MSSRITRFVAPFLLFILFFLLYSGMAAPELDWGDAGESQLAAWTAGLSHPTGYPLFLSAGWLWTHSLALAGMAPTRAMTLFTVVMGAATVACILPATMALLRRATEDGEAALTEGWCYAISVAIAILFGLSPTFWSQTLLAEVYTMHLLLLVLLLWALWSLPVRQGSGYGGNRLRFGLAALLAGLFLSHHRSAILWLPGLLLWLWYEARWLFQARALLWLSAWVLLPQLAYLYIPLRGPVTPYLHQGLTGGQTLTLYDGSTRAFLEHVSGSVFAADVGLRESLWARLEQVGALLARNLSAVLLLLLPLMRLPRRASDLLLLLAGAGFTLLFGLFYAIGDVEVMFIPAWLALYWLAALGMARLTRIAPRVALTSGIVVALLAVAGHWHNAPESRADHTAPRELVNALLGAEPPQDAILLSNDRNEIVPVWYAQFADGQREDLLVLAPRITTAPEHAHIVALTEWALRFERPVYLTKSMPGLALRYEFAPATPPLVHVLGAARLPTLAPAESTLTPALSVSAWEAPIALRAGERVTVPVALLPHATPDVPLTFSLQLFDSAGNRLAQQDVAPDRFYPPTEWTAGTPVRQIFTLTLPDPLPDAPFAWRLSAYFLNADGTITGQGQQILLGESR